MTGAIRLSSEDYSTNSTARTRPASSNSIPSNPGPAFAVPESQLYYWTQAWQENERRAAEEIARGEVVRFSDPADAVRWLLSDD